MDRHLDLTRPPRRRPCRATTPSSAARRSSTAAGANAYGNQTYAGNGAPTPATARPPTRPVGHRHARPPATRRSPRGPMTIDSVVQKTAITLGRRHRRRDGDLDPDAGRSPTRPRRRPRPLSRAGDDRQPRRLRAVDGQLVQAGHQPRPWCWPSRPSRAWRSARISKVFDAQFDDGIVIGAVIGTFAAFAGTLAAYKFFNIKVGDKFRTFVIAAMFGMVGLSLMELVLSLFGIDTRPLRLRRPRHAVRRRRPGARRVHADPRLRLRRAGHRRPASPSASRGGRRSP